MNNKKKTVTVVTVVKNSEKLVEKTIVSVLSQTFTSFNYIIIDGGSADKTEIILNKYKKKINKIIFKTDNGIYEAMNLGIRASNSEWIIFLNAGDTFCNKNVLRDIFLNKKYKEKILFGNAIRDFKSPKKWFGNFYTRYSYIMPFSHQAAFINTNFHKKNLYDPNNKITSDFIFFFNAYIKKIRFRKINNFISLVDTNGISNNKRFLSYYELIKFFFIKRFFLNCLLCILYLFYIQLKYLIKRTFILQKI